ncbi:MAG: hypothetical protein IT473_00710 [Lysobacter sp.]|nr:hypothetical protein [Lysobacter sp.]
MSNWFEDENPDAPGNEKRIRDKPVRDGVVIDDPKPPSRLIDSRLKDRIDHGGDYRDWLEDEKRLNDRRSGLDRLRDGDVPPEDELPQDELPQDELPQDEPPDEDPATPEG